MLDRTTRSLLCVAAQLVDALHFTIATQTFLGTHTSIQSNEHAHRYRIPSACTCTDLLAPLCCEIMLRCAEIVECWERAELAGCDENSSISGGIRALSNGIRRSAHNTVSSLAGTERWTVTIGPRTIILHDDWTQKQTRHNHSARGINRNL